MPDEVNVVEDQVVADSTPAEDLIPDLDVTADDTAEDGVDSPIPYERFKEVNQQLKDAREKLDKYEGTSTDDLLAARDTKQDGDGLPGADVAKHVQQLEDRLALNELKSQYDDVSKYAKDMAALVKKNPSLDWSVAYKAAKHDDLAKNARQEGRNEAYQNISEKQSATIESPGAKQIKQVKNIDAMLADKSTDLAEIEKLLPKG